MNLNGKVKFSCGVSCSGLKLSHTYWVSSVWHTELWFCRCKDQKEDVCKELNLKILKVDCAKHIFRNCLISGPNLQFPKSLLIGFFTKIFILFYFVHTFSSLNWNCGNQQNDSVKRQAGISSGGYLWEESCLW